MVAILCAATNGVYTTLPGLDIYDIQRDVRTFSGEMPVVAHPPCRAWSAFCAHQAKPRPGEKELAPLCVDWLRKCGGVLEHPAHSRLWDALHLPKPGQEARREFWSMEVHQEWWGHSMKKRTWLLFSGVTPHDLPAIPFRMAQGGYKRRWQLMSKKDRQATPKPFAEWLISVAQAAGGVLA